jgi:hypothetical protein
VWRRDKNPGQDSGLFESRLDTGFRWAEKMDEEGQGLYILPKEQKEFNGNRHTTKGRDLTRGLTLSERKSFFESCDHCQKPVYRLYLLADLQKSFLESLRKTVYC